MQLYSQYSIVRDEFRIENKVHKCVCVHISMPNNFFKIISNKCSYRLDVVVSRKSIMTKAFFGFEID